MRRTPNRGEGIVTYFALVNKSGKSTLISEFEKWFGRHPEAELLKD